MNPRPYYPAFAAVAGHGTPRPLEAEGQETADAPRKDAAAQRWCENATALTGTPWGRIKVPQEDSGALRPCRLADFAALAHFPAPASLRAVTE